MKVRIPFIILFYFSIVFAQSSPQYNWVISYPLYSTESGRLLASGDTTVIMRAEFVDVNTASDNTLLSFSVRPVTSHLTNWYIRSLQLWQNNDSDPSTLNTSTDQLLDTKLSANFSSFGLGTPQQTPDNRVTFDLPGNSIALGTNAVFFVVAEVQDFRTDAVNDVEITDQNGVTIGMTVQKADQDLVVFPTELSNDWDGDVTKEFTIKAVNLPVVVRNPDPSAEENDTYYPQENMFFPNFYAMNSSDSSKQQRLQDLTFDVSIVLDTLLLQDSLSYVSLWIGWDNDIIELDTMVHGDLWDDKWDPISLNGGHYNFQTGTGDSSNFLMVRFESWVTTTEDPPYVQVNNNSIADLTFHVRKPGISPIFIKDEVILDRWGIQYHTYRKIRNNATDDLYTSGVKYDGWAKFILGDYSGPESSGNLGSGIGDAKVQFEDISLFSDYLFIGTGDTNWYNRFDIGAERFHDPDGIVQYDDTTNFYDLLIFGANYYRSQRGNFAQKRVEIADEPVVLEFSPENRGDQYYAVGISVKNAHNILASHIKVQFDPQEMQYLSCDVSPEIKQSLSDYTLLIPDKPVRKGMIDINFLSGSRALEEDGTFITLNFKKIIDGKPSLDAPLVDFRDISGNRIQYQVRNELLPLNYSLLSCYPNPFNPNTMIRFRVEKAGLYKIRIYDLLGNEVNALLEEKFSPGVYRISWDGRDAQGRERPSGVYFVRLSGPGVEKVQKITLLK